MSSIFRYMVIALAVLAATAAGGPAMAQHFEKDGLMVHKPWARASAGHIKTGAAYMEIMAMGGDGDRLVAIETGVADRAEIHTHAAVDGVMKMMKLNGADVAPGEPAVFKPGGLHIMFFGLKAPLIEGNAFPMTLIFKNAGRLDVMVTVRPVGAMSDGMDHSDHGS